MRISGRAFFVLAALVVLAVVHATGQIAPAATDHQAELRIWLAARATGIAALILLTVQVLLGLVLSHPTNQATWRLSKWLFPWHEHLLLFAASLLVVHVVSLVVDPYAGVGIGGALLPGLSAYRTSAVALGTLATYALIATAITARYTRLLPTGIWLKVHRLALVVLVLAWLHGLLAGTDSGALRPLYVVSFGLVAAAAAHRYWVSRRARPTREPIPVRPTREPIPARPTREPIPSVGRAPGSPIAVTIAARVRGDER